jgi:hypothetical protein
MQLEVRIERLGAKGDGVASGPEGPIFVPFALPGERVRVAVEPDNDLADLIEVLEASPERIEPVFGHIDPEDALVHVRVPPCCWSTRRIAMRARAPTTVRVKTVTPAVPRSTRSQDHARKPGCRRRLHLSGAAPNMQYPGQARADEIAVEPSATE